MNTQRNEKMNYFSVKPILLHCMSRATHLPIILAFRVVAVECVKLVDRAVAVDLEVRGPRARHAVRHRRRFLVSRIHLANNNNASVCY